MNKSLRLYGKNSILEGQPLRSQSMKYYRRYDDTPPPPAVTEAINEVIKKIEELINEARESDCEKSNEVFSK